MRPARWNVYGVYYNSCHPESSHTERRDRRVEKGKALVRVTAEAAGLDQRTDAGPAAGTPACQLRRPKPPVLEPGGRAGCGTKPPLSGGAGGYRRAPAGVLSLRHPVTILGPGAVRSAAGGPDSGQAGRAVPQRPARLPPGWNRGQMAPRLSGGGIPGGVPGPGAPVRRRPPGRGVPGLSPGRAVDGGESRLTGDSPDGGTLSRRPAGGGGPGGGGLPGGAPRRVPGRCAGHGGLS